VATVAPGAMAALAAAAEAAGVALTEIGTVAEGRGARFLDRAGNALLFKQPSFSHF
jgi:thiamine monophosphate kinase